MKRKKWLIGILVIFSLLLVLSGCGKTKTAKNIDHDDFRNSEILENQSETLNNICEALNDEGLVSSKSHSVSYSKFDGSTGILKSFEDEKENYVYATVHILNSHDEAVELANYTSEEEKEDSFVFGNIAVHVSKKISDERSEEYENKLPEIIGREFERCQIQEDLSGFKGQNLLNVVNKVEELGYTGTYQVPSGEDRTAEVKAFDDETLQNWQMTDVVSVDPKAQTVALKISTNSDVAQANLKKSLQDTFPVSYAWTALKTYGKSLYPYGFKVHNILGIYAEEPVDENTWFLKADVTITNAFNAKYDTVVEAKVTGNTNSQEVTSFYVYE